MLKVKDLCTYYGKIYALKSVSLELNKGEIISLIGNNGAGKTTLLNTIAGIVPATSGSVEFEGQDITNNQASAIVQSGISMAPEGREVFPSMTVFENLKLGAYTRNDKKEIEESFERVYDLFPRLAERKTQYAGTLSGGEQQMLAIGRALMSKPKLLLLDEPSLGLAPNLVALIFRLIQSINQQGTPILLIEQNANMALKIAHRAYCLETGTIVLEGTVDELRNNDQIRKIYLGDRK